MINESNHRKTTTEKEVSENKEECNTAEQLELKKSMEEIKKGEIRVYSNEELNRITRNYFNMDSETIDWKKTKPFFGIFSVKTLENRFTPNVYWHYINNQYFPIKLFSSNIDHLFNEANENFENIVRLNRSSLSVNDDLACFLAENNKKENLTVEQLIIKCENDLEKAIQKIALKESLLSERIQKTLDPTKATTHNLMPSSNPHTVQLTYTKNSLIELTKFANNLDDKDILKDSIYHSEIDAEYLEHRDKLLRKPIDFSLPKKCIQSSRKHVNTRSHTIFEVSEIRITPGFEASLPKIPYSYRYNCQVCGDNKSDHHNRLFTCSVTFNRIHIVM